MTETMKTPLTPKQIDNLQYVLEELPKHADKNPYVRREFSMGDYGCYENSCDVSNCATHGCLLGHIATLPRFKEKFDEYKDDDGYFNYSNFSSLEFFCEFIEKGELRTWEYLFSERWTSSDYTTFEDAIQRVKNLLEHGCLVKDYSYETMEIIS